MAKFNKCSCHLTERTEDDFLLTTHHPKCNIFNPASELKGLEKQCKHFMKIITDLKDKIREMEKITNLELK